MLLRADIRRLLISAGIVFFLLTATITVKAQDLAAVDTDGDGLTDQQELTVYHTDLLVADTDNDGFSDGAEVKSGYSPLKGNKMKLRDIDSDKDGLTDDWEIILGTDLLNPDTDGDGHKDGEEVMAGFGPTSTSTSKVSKKIIVSLAKQSLTYSFNNKTLDSFPISSGVKYLPTPKGEYTLLKKVPVVNYVGTDYSYLNTKWNLLFLRKKYGYYIHGAYWHNKFGQPMSHGCVNVSYSNMERLYNWADTETQITIQ
ncbi:MAG: L,D-transpeptidase family protein [Candidatus Komeilibacteria bacterium]